MKRVKLVFLCLSAGVMLSYAKVWGQTIGMGSNYQEEKDYKETLLNLNLEMVYVASGTFEMGATPGQDDDAYDDEKPVHEVTLYPYHIGRYEITQAQWRAIMGTTIEQQRDNAEYYWNEPLPLYGVGDNYPMYYVSWKDAKTFCERLSAKTGRKYVLPTEAQWEFAARGGLENSDDKYSGSDIFDIVTWYSGNSGGKAHIVGKKYKNDLGIHDMSGNVWEWCADGYGPYSSDYVFEPKALYPDNRYVIRGGSWDYDITYCRVSCRGERTAEYSRFNLGFRVVCLPESW